MASSKYAGVSAPDAEPGLRVHTECRPEQFSDQVGDVLVATNVHRRKVEGLYVFRLAELFATANETAIGFGLPNAFMINPDGEGGVDKFSAKSFKRGPAAVSPKVNLVQSGILIWFPGLSDDAKSALRAAMHEHEGELFETCGNAVMHVFQDAGFTSGDTPLTGLKLPHDILVHILRNGLKWRGEDVQVRVIRTSSLNLERFWLWIIRSELATFRRHFRRFLEAKAKGGGIGALPLWLWTIPERVKAKLFGVKSVEQFETQAPGLPYDGHYRGFELSVSMPSQFGRLMRMVWDSHALFRVCIKGFNVSPFLKKHLQAFPQKDGKKLSFVTRLKKKVLMSPFTVKRIGSILCPQFVPVGEKNERDLQGALRTHTDKNPNKYNLTIVGEGEHWDLTIARVKVGLGWLNKIADWLLSKHVLMTQWSDLVLFAGEIWKGEDGTIYVSGNSGTYKPEDPELDAVVLLLQVLLPHCRVVKVDRDGNPVVAAAV